MLRHFYPAQRAEVIFCIVVAAVTVFFFMLPTGFENPQQYRNVSYVRGVVQTTDNSEITQHGVVKTGIQRISVIPVYSKWKDTSIAVTNTVAGQLYRDNIYQKGDNVLVAITHDEENSTIRNAKVSGYYRIRLEVILLGIFALFLILFAGWTGIKALLSFLFAAVVLWKAVLPAFLHGYNPVVVTLGGTSMLCTIIILLIAGFQRKAWVALGGSLAGIVLTCVLALGFGALFNVPGTVRDFSETLLYSGFGDLDFTAMFLCGIFLSAAGAVMDCAMDVAAAQHEVRTQHPGISASALIRSGFAVSRVVVGTMTTTLLFAYSGGFMFLLMTFIAQGIPLVAIVNMNYVAGEILTTLVGSFGLVSVAPLTALWGGFLFTRVDS